MQDGMQINNVIILQVHRGNPNGVATIPGKFSQQILSLQIFHDPRFPVVSSITSTGHWPLECRFLISGLIAVGKKEGNYWKPSGTVTHLQKDSEKKTQKDRKSKKLLKILNAI